VLGRLTPEQLAAAAAAAVVCTRLCVSGGGAGRRGGRGRRRRAETGSFTEKQMCDSVFSISELETLATPSLNLRGGQVQIFKEHMSK